MKFTKTGLIKEEKTDYDMLRSFQREEQLNTLGDIISKYVEDPDDVDKELDLFDDGGFDALSNMVAANLDRDPEYKAWANKFQLKEENKKNIKEKVTDFLTSEGVKFQVATGIGVIIAGLMRNPDLIDKLLSLIGLKEGSCGYNVGGNINPEDTSSNTPGGLKSMTADKRTQIVKNIMEKMKSNKS